MSIRKELIQGFNWNIASGILIAAYLLIALSKTLIFPVYLNVYYHLQVMQGFDLAGGVVTWGFWEFAPAGRPHFYPPLLHIIMLLAYELGLPKTSIAISFSFIIFPLLLISVWQISRKVFSPRQAFFMILSLLVSYSIFLGLTNTLAATGALVILLWLFYALEKRKKIAAVILTALLFYTHYAISIMGILTILLYLYLRKEDFKKKSILILLGIILALPWLIHFFVNFGYLTRTIYYDFALEINVFLLLFSMSGIFLLARQGGPGLFFLSLLLIGLAGTIKHPYRFFSTQPAIALIFLAALAMERLFNWINLKVKIRGTLTAVLFIFISNLLSISVVVTPGFRPRMVSDSLCWNMLLFPKQDPALHSFRGVSFYRRYGKEFYKIIDIINDYTERGDIIYSNFSYQAGLFSAFTERANATMSPYTLERGLPQEKYIKNAKLILWLKNPQGSMEEELTRFINNMKLEKIKETEMFYVYRNPHVDYKMRISQPVIPTRIAFLLVFVSLGLIVWDWLRVK